MANSSIDGSGDAVLDALESAPMGAEDLSVDELDELARRAEELQTGRVQPIEHAAVRRALEAARKLAG